METTNDVLTTLVQHVLVGETRDEALAILAPASKDKGKDGEEKDKEEKGTSQTSGAAQRTTSRTP